MKRYNHQSRGMRIPGTGSILLLFAGWVILVGCNKGTPTIPNIGGDNANVQGVLLDGKILSWKLNNGQTVAPSGEVSVDKVGIRVTITADGAFTINGLTPGTYSLTFKHSTGSTARMDSLTIDQEGQANVRIKIEHGKAFLTEKEHIHGDKADLMGRVHSLDNHDHAFTLLTSGIEYVITWDTSTKWIHLNGVQDLRVGDTLEIKGRITGPQQVLAQKIRQHEPQNDNHNDGQKIKVCGAIEAVDPMAQTLTVQDTTFFWNDQTEFKDITPAHLAIGLIVEVKGVAQADGTWWADEIQAENHCGDDHNDDDNHNDDHDHNDDDNHNDDHD